jgi:hypothetical protein
MHNKKVRVVGVMLKAVNAEMIEAHQNMAATKDAHAETQPANE